MVLEEIDDVSAGSADGPVDVERAELVDGIPLTSIDATSGLSGDSSTTSDVIDSEMLSLFSGSPSRVTS